jgi:hypothetical protein
MGVIYGMRLEVVGNFFLNRKCSLFDKDQNQIVGLGYLNGRAVNISALLRRNIDDTIPNEPITCGSWSNEPAE